jgi:predicted permease
LALAVLLITAAGLMLRTLRELASVDPGFEADGVVTATIHLPTGTYAEDESVLTFHRALLERLRALPGVEAVGSTDALPLQGSTWTSDFAIEGRAPLERGADFNRRIVSPGYFDAMGVRLLRGRMFGISDGDGTLPVALVNATLARVYFPNADPVGQRIAFEREPAPDEPWYTIVGVVGSERLEGLGEVREWPEVFLPASQQPSQLIRVVVRSSIRPEAQAGALRTAVHALDQDVAVTDARPMDAVVGAAMARERFLSVVFGTFAFLALALAAVGTYGVMAHTVSSRTREFGVRMAVGAAPAMILRLVLRQGVTLGLAGTVLGVMATLVATRLIRGLLFRVSPMDPITFVMVVAILTGVALVACLIPALRATRIEPMEALRHE